VKVGAVWPTTKKKLDNDCSPHMHTCRLCADAYTKHHSVVMGLAYWGY